MRPTKVMQDGIRITQEQPDNVVIEMNGSSITLTEENTELLRVMLYEADPNDGNVPRKKNLRRIRLFGHSLKHKVRRNRMPTQRKSISG